MVFIITSNALHCAHEVGMGLFEIRLYINCGLGNPYTVISFFFRELPFRQPSNSPHVSALCYMQVYHR